MSRSISFANLKGFGPGNILTKFHSLMLTGSGEKVVQIRSLHTTDKGRWTKEYLYTLALKISSDKVIKPCIYIAILIVSLLCLKKIKVYGLTKSPNDKTAAVEQPILRHSSYEISIFINNNYNIFNDEEEPVNKGLGQVL